MDTTENIIKGKVFDDWFDKNDLSLDGCAMRYACRAAFMAGWQAALDQQNEETVQFVGNFLSGQ